MRLWRKKKGKKTRNASPRHDDGHRPLYGLARRRAKADWAGTSYLDAFKRELDYYSRITAQRMFDKVRRQAQQVAAHLAGVATQGGAYQPKTKPQLSPCYTSYPTALAVHAAIGLTAYLEFQGHASDRVLLQRMAGYLRDPAARDHVDADPDLYRKLATCVARNVQTRLLLADLVRAGSLGCVDIYTLFSASQQNMKFRSLPEIIKAVILYGDILPDWRTGTLHPMTRSILDDLDAVSQRYFDALASASPEAMLDIGAAWVRTACRALADYLPRPKAADELPAPRVPGGAGPVPEGGQYRFGGQDDKPADNEAIAPLDGPNPPALFDEPSPMEQAVRALKDAASDSEGSAKDDEKAQAAMNAALQQFSAAVNAASGQKSEWEDMRQDLLTHMLRAMDFCTGPIEGSPTDGHEVSIQLDGDRMAGGEIFDRAVEPSEDIAACDKLLDQSADVAEALRRTLYPNVEERPVTTHLRSSGTLDPARLAMAAFSDVVYKRHRIEEHADRRGRPLLLIACDGSGSLDERQMQMVKVLATAWLTSTAKSQVQVLAALYHSGSVRRGVTGPLVQWIYHPQKTPAIPRTEAARAVVTLPNTGTGVQSDALSLAFLMDEAFRVARGRMVYLILISDCEWNQSFGKERSGEQEVQAVFEATYDQHPNKLHATLVALGVDGETNFEDLLEKVIAVPEAELTNSAAVAERIGTYVARCMKERHDLLARR